MTLTHAYMAGTPENPGHIYYEQQGAWLRCELEPEDVIAALDAQMEVAAPVEPAPVWSEWLEHHGGPCPLPPGVYVQWASPEGVSETTPGPGNWEYPGRYRYRHTTPGGWIGRGDFIPPASLWAEGSPVRCEWINATVDSGVIFREGFEFRSGWTRATHIRLLPAEPAKARLPEGFRIVDGCLLSPNGRVAFAAFEIDRYGTATIRAAVKAWCAAMERR